MNGRPALLLFAAALAGCTAASPTLLVQRAETGASYDAKFDRAYFSQSADGQIDVVLLSDGQGASPAVDRPLETSDRQTVRQVVHLRVLWSNPRGIRLDNPSASNATIDWHVIVSPKDRVSYTGAAWAKADIDGDVAELDIRNATVSISQLSGHTDDPLKRASLSGTFTARRAEATVQSYIDEIARFERSDPTENGSPMQRAPNVP